MVNNGAGIHESFPNRWTRVSLPKHLHHGLCLGFCSPPALLAVSSAPGTVPDTAGLPGPFADCSQEVEAVRIPFAFTTISPMTLSPLNCYNSSEKQTVFPIQHIITHIILSTQLYFVNLSR